MSTPPISTGLKLCYIALAVTDTWLCGQHAPWARRARLITKPLLMPTLAGSLATSARATGSPLRTGTLVAQAAGWGGDLALLGHGTKPFLVGAGSFGVGHVAYLSGFLRHRDAHPISEALGARVVAGSWLATAPLMALMAGRRQRELSAPVIGYASMLAAVVAGATHLGPELSRASRRLSVAGAGLFMVSDTLLGIGRFALADPPPRLEMTVMATYTAAQFLLSEGAARA